MNEKIYTIKFINIGREKFNGTRTLAARSLEEVEIEAEHEAKKHLMSREVFLNMSKFAKNKGWYTVYAGMHTVGNVEIISSKIPHARKS